MCYIYLPRPDMLNIYPEYSYSGIVIMQNVQGFVYISKWRANIFAVNFFLGSVSSLSL